MVYLTFSFKEINFKTRVKGLSNLDPTPTNEPGSITTIHFVFVNLVLAQNDLEINKLYI